MQGKSDDLSACPSFNYYSSDRIAAIATEVSREFSDEDEAPSGDTSRGGLDDGDDDDFEFSLVLGEDDVSAEEIVYDGQIRPIFPIFNRDLVRNDGEEREMKPNDDDSTLRIPLKKLFIEDREEPLSSSSSEADELESMPSGTYCVWRPKFVKSLPNRCKKSNSTGSSGSKRWKFRDLLRRSNSDGKEPMVFLTPKNRDGKTNKERRNFSEGVNVAGKVKAVGVKAPASSVHEVFYVRNRAQKEESKRKSYLPYRQDLVGFFAHVNGMGKSFPF